MYQNPKEYEPGAGYRVESRQCLLGVLTLGVEGWAEWVPSERDGLLRAVLLDLAPQAVSLTNRYCLGALSLLGLGDGFRKFKLQVGQELARLEQQYAQEPLWRYSVLTSLANLAHKGRLTKEQTQAAYEDTVVLLGKLSGSLGFEVFRLDKRKIELLLWLSEARDLDAQTEDLVTELNEQVDGEASKQKAIELEKAAAIEHARALAEEKAKHEAEEKRKKEEQVKAEAEAAEKKKKEDAAKLKADAEAKAKAEAEVKAKADADAKAKADAAKAKEDEAKAKAKAEADAKTKAEAEAKAKIEADAKAKAEAEAKAKAEADAKKKDPPKDVQPPAKDPPPKDNDAKGQPDGKIEFMQAMISN